MVGGVAVLCGQGGTPVHRYPLPPSVFTHDLSLSLASHPSSHQKYFKELLDVAISRKLEIISAVTQGPRSSQAPLHNTQFRSLLQFYRRVLKNVGLTARGFCRLGSVKCNTEPRNMGDVIMRKSIV